MSTVDARLAKIHISDACDVANPLCGEKGAARIYGPQKGATPEMVEVLTGTWRTSLTSSNAALM